MRLKIEITGLVQGVGFRPFVHRLAGELGLKGYVINDASGVLIEVEGEKERLDDFLVRLEQEKPDISRIFSLRHAFLEGTGFKGFEIRESSDEGEKRALILPDIAVCGECLKDITNPKDRRFLYPFTNCTNCGPRFTIINSLPYDRENTSMKKFRMCPDCRKEYNLPSDRRFHAQPDACDVCGPWISLYDCQAKPVCSKHEALEKAVHLIRKGYIIAVKGVGGYHLICDATDEKAVSRLRKRKHREEKPMAVMFPDIDSIKREVYLGALEERAVNSVERPVVIVGKKETTMLAGAVSPGNSTVGVFLPYTPLHYMVLKKLRKPVIATSANITDGPIVKDEADAFSRLSGIADYFLSHNRDIVRRCDDSVVRIMAERQSPIRRSRGFAPLPVTVPFRFNKPVLALGPYMNNTIAVGVGDRVFLSQHIGDLDTPLAVEFYEETIHDFLRIFDLKPGIAVSDMHPGYYSTKYGESHFRENLLKVQHHYAHILSCMTENEVHAEEEVIGFAFDGTGYGPDKTVWGGEVFIASYREFKRIYHMEPYKLPGGEKAVTGPCRTAFSLLYGTFGEKAKDMDVLPLTREEKTFFADMLRNGVNSPVTTSMGRLFDGVASIIGLAHTTSYHAQAAIALEQSALKSDTADSYPCIVKNNKIYQFPIIDSLVEDLNAGVPKEVIARKFHNTVVGIILSIAETARDETGIKTVALSGGVFQNVILLENSVANLRERGFTPLVHQTVPANDGGISLGQAVAGHYHQL
ncbi:MAG: carbamoyltransferase HypF [Nitrospiraceae bacterium]|nr:MAG: carbamoyltransferase HypF [Nitrospiraceae bacterium]